MEAWSFFANFVFSSSSPWSSGSAARLENFAEVADRFGVDAGFQQSIKVGLARILVGGLLLVGFRLGLFGGRKRGEEDIQEYQRRGCAVSSATGENAPSSLESRATNIEKLLP